MSFSMRVGGILLVTTVLGACGQFAAPAGVAGDAMSETREFRASGMAGFSKHVGHEGAGRMTRMKGGAHEKGARGEYGPGSKEGHRGLFGGLDLSDEQKAQLKAIAEKYRLAKSAEKPATSPRHALAELLKAEPLDVAALRGALAERGPGFKRPGLSLDMLKEQRAVLTEAQRATLVERLKAQSARKANHERPALATPSAEQRQARLNRVAERLKLDENQKAALADFEAALESSRSEAPKVDFSARHEAMISFFETGDTSKFDFSAQQVPAFPVDAFVALAQSLNPQQRQAVLLGYQHGRKGFKGRHR